MAVEGLVTENDYFALLGSYANIDIKCLNGPKSAPKQVLDRMQKALAKKDIRSTDEAWLVVDKDRWTDEQLKCLLAWCKGNKHLALSNPNFEYWLLLHFEDGKGVEAGHCCQRLRKYLPNYDKHLGKNYFSKDRIQAAIERAQAKDIPPCKTWPNNNGSTVYRLVQNILSSS